MTSNADFERVLRELYKPDALSVRQRILFDERLEERVSRLSFSLASGARVVVRSATSAAASASICFALFFLMHSLIRQEAQLVPVTPSSEIELVRLPRPEESPKRLTAVKPGPQEPPPPIPRSENQDDGDGTTYEGILIEPVDPGTGFEKDFGPTDTDPVVLVRVAPQYPPRAAERGVQGWVLVEFTIDPTGAVRDPVVIDADPKGVFERAAIRAVERWKYRPKIEAGKPTARRGIQTVLRFELDPQSGRER